MTIAQKRTLFDAILWEPAELIKAQPPQIFISAASAYLIAAEAAVLLPSPFSVLLAIGAEWGYLRGMASAATVITVWKNRLTYANGALVVLYGALFSLRQFGALPSVEAYQNGAAQTDPVSAVVMTFIHIACIGAVTVCAMLAHAAMLEHEARVKSKQVADEEERNRRREAEADARNLRLQQAHDDLAIEMQRRDAELRLMEETERRKLAIRAERAQFRAVSHQAQPRSQPKIIYNGVEYPSVQAAADAHGISRQAMSKRLRKASNL